MCGFTGFIGTAPYSSVVLERMMNTIEHRGPDSSGMFVENNAALGFRRLSIIDLEADSQPLYNEDKSLVLVFNGEIYNFLQLREELTMKGHTFLTHTDSEVLIHGYEEYGEKLIEKLRGMFSFVIWDRKKEKVFGVRDMFGIKPFYYAQMNGTLLFGSEIKSFLPHPHFNKELNKSALKPYLTFQFPVLNETFFRNVFKLPAAHFMTYQHGELRVQRYWSPEFKPLEEQPLNEIVEEIDQVVKESIQIHQISDVKVGSFLSSGVDSSYVASVLRPNKTFTVGFSDKNFSEIDNAKALSDELGIDNVNVILNADNCFKKLADIQYMMDEPHSNPSIVPLYFLSELASQDVTVILSGEGADELFGGYAEYDATPPMKKYKKVPKMIRRPLGMAAKVLPRIKGKNFLIKGGLSPEEWFIGHAKIFDEKEAHDVLNSEYQEAPTVREIVKPYYDKVKKEEDIIKMQHLDLHLWLVDDILLKADKMSMAHSIELRVPFLDKEVMKVAAKVPVKYRVNNIDTKYAFRLAAGRALPLESANRKKIGFPVPIRYWLREEKYYLEIKTLFEGDAAAEFFDQEKIIKLLNDHYHSKRNNARKIWTVFMFLLWYKKYFEEEMLILPSVLESNLFELEEVKDYPLEPQVKFVT